MASIINVLIRPIVEYFPENNRLERIWKLAQVDFRKRYYNDRLGLLWALLNPLMRISVYYTVFKFIFKVQIENFGLFIFAGMIFWIFFTESANRGMTVIKSKKYLIENIQFKKIDLFYSHTLSTLLGFMFNLFAYLILCLVLGQRFGWDILLLPILIFNVGVIAMGTSMILATIYIFVKDIYHAWSIITLIGFWSSGIFFSGEKFLDFMPSIIYFQPFVGIIMNSRSITLGVGDWNWTLAFIDLGIGFILLGIGVFIFNKFSFKALEKL